MTAAALPCAAQAADCGSVRISARFADAATLCGASAPVVADAASTAANPAPFDTPQTVAIRMAGSRTVRAAGTGRVPVAAARRLVGAPAPDRLLHAVGQRYRVDPHLLAAVMHTESRGRLNAVSPKGALGLMQVMPATARSMGVAYPRTMLSDPVLALSTGALYLKTLQAQLGNNVPLVVAAYNAGPGAVRKYRGIPRYRETQGYVTSVMGRYVASRAR